MSYFVCKKSNIVYDYPAEALLNCVVGCEFKECMWNKDYVIPRNSSNKEVS